MSTVQPSFFDPRKAGSSTVPEDQVLNFGINAAVKQDSMAAGKFQLFILPAYPEFRIQPVFEKLGSQIHPCYQNRRLSFRPDVWQYSPGQKKFPQFEARPTP